MMTSQGELGFAQVLSKDGGEVRLAMQELRLSGTLLPVGARLHVSHAFKSAESKPLEAIYSFVLPRDAALRRFLVKGDGFEVHSDLKPVEEAVKAYEEGIEQGHLSSLARVYRDGVVNLNVGNIRPGEVVLVELEILAGVELHDDGFRFRFPFALAPAYHAKARPVLVRPGAGELELPEDQFGDVVLPTWTTDSKELHGIGFELKIDAGQVCKEIASPSHPLRVQNRSDTEVLVGLSTDKDVPNRDLVLDIKYQTAKNAVLAGLAEGGKGHFAVIVPSSEFGRPARCPKRIVFLLDRSGSMGGLPIQQAKRALEACLGAMGEHDRFNVIAFDNHTEVLAMDLQPADKENRALAKLFLAKVDTRGGTELLAGLHEATRQLGSEGGEILVVTDGQVMATEDVIGGIQKQGIRIHCLGIGSASQDRFLSLLARQTGGVSRFLTPRERVDLAAVELFSAVSNPVAAQLRCEIEGLPGATVVPAASAFVFEGTPFHVWGHCEGAGEGRVRLTWLSDGETKTLEIPLSVHAKSLGETLRLLQGARRITDLESQVASDETTPAGAKRTRSRSMRILEQLSREYGLASRAMALCAVYQRQGDVAGQLPHTHIVPVGIPQDVEFRGYWAVSPVRQTCSPAPECVASSEPPLDYLAPSSSSACAPLEHPGHAMGPWPQRTVEFMGRVEDASGSREGGEVLRRSSPMDPADLLVEISAKLEPDGGMPGQNVEERILASLITLALFHQEGHTAQHGAFRLHVQRLIAFLGAADLEGMEESRRNLVHEFLKKVSEGGAIPGDWRTLVAKFALQRKIAVAKVWQEVEKILTLAR